ncbi:hypothetical protein KZ829_11890 [Actinoplanes hulinensis]|uniref:Uncharacterized protein n=1 Tax=Actinoplanes hulinensis TaxID=1144547 RepID=A0ABS7B191_9ACTN|nr:hypothetical protein [Actinoplanes hulinensis]MBW6434436.1 hypothetical protein [Actinoplanes hulinensis]
MIRQRTLRYTTVAISIFLGATLATPATAATADSPQFTTALIGEVRLTAEGVNAFQITPVTTGAPAPTPVTTSALPSSAFAPHDANIINSRSSIAGGSFNACKDFNSTTCILANGTGTLQPGESTEGRYGWPDSDGFYCMTHRSFQVNSSTVTCSTNKWVKVSGGLVGQIDVSIIVRNR